MVTSACQAPQWGRSTAQARSASMHPGAGTASGLSRRMSGAVEARTPAWQPPAKPRLSPLSMTVASGAAARTASGVPSVEALSTTTTSSPRPSCARSACSVRTTSAALSWHTTTTATRGAEDMSAADGQVPRDPGGLDLALSVGRPVGLEARDALLQKAHALGQHLVLVGQPRDHQREVQEHREHETEGDDEERRRRVVDADGARDALKQVLPHRQPEQDGR